MISRLKILMTSRLKILMTSRSKKETQMYFLFSQKSGKRTTSKFPNRAPMGKEALLQGILYISQKLHLSGSPLKEPFPKFPFMESLAEGCPTTTALHSSIKAPPHPTYQAPLGSVYDLQRDIIPV